MQTIVSLTGHSSAPARSPDPGHDGTPSGVVTGHSMIESIQNLDQRLVRYFGPDCDVAVPREIAILGECCFSKCSTFGSISFCEEFSFHIPRLVERIHGSAFGEWTTGNVTVDGENRAFCMEGDFLVDSEHRKVVRYFGPSSRVVIGKDIEVLGAGSFSGHPRVLHCRCEDGSQLRVIESEAFWNSSVLDVTLPPSVRTFERKAFVSTCHVSISGIGGDDEAKFRAWEVEREATPSLALNLESF